MGSRSTSTRLPSLGRASSALLLLTAVALGGPLAGCSSGTPTTKTPHGEAGVAPTRLDDAQFAAAALRVLAHPDGSEERLKLLLGVVQTQLEHAAVHFERGQDERGTRAVLGGFLLLRRGEASPRVVGAPGGAGDRALAGAVRFVSARGDEGQARALLELRRQSAPPAEKARVEESLRALDTWARDTRTGSKVEIAGLAERAAVGRAMVDPSEAALKAAEEAIGVWIGAAIENRLAFQQSGQRPPPREAYESTRALGVGAATMVALHLRHGDAEAALDAIERTDARRIVQPAFYAVIQGAAGKDESGRPWRALWSAIEEETGGQVGGDFGLEPALFEAARLHVALEAWRREPTDEGAAIVLAGALASFGMPEVSPLVVVDAMKKSTDPQFASAVTRLLGLALRESLDDPPTARRIYRSATEALALAERGELRGQVQPSASDVREMMGGVELRAGQLAQARPLLEAVAREAPSTGAYLTLALLERQAQKPDAALGWVARATSEPFAANEPIAAAEAMVLAYEIHRARGATAEAGKALDGALRRAVAAQKAAKPGAARARAERLLSKVLDAYGDARGATQAQDRALKEVEGDRKLFGATLLDGIARALVRRDVEHGRKLLRRGIEERIEADDMIYGALWVKLLETAARQPSDGTVAAALDAIDDRADGSWTGKLGRWAIGKLPDAELARLAQSDAQRIEAAFYAAMQRRVGGDASGDAGLRQVAESGHIDLVEVQLARDLLAPPMKLDRPGDVQLP